MPDFILEQQYNGFVAGFDEAGCGPWAGPVVAAAVIFLTYDLPPEIFDLIDDSKLLSKAKREKAFQWLLNFKGTRCEFAVAQADVDEIDSLNIRQAAFLAMTRALKQLSTQPIAALVDGITLPRFPIPVQAIKKGDSKSYSIAAASILAKVTRDNIMTTLAQDFPCYGWERNAGYGTKEHQSALKNYGVSPHHRRSFAPIAELLRAA